MSIKVITCTVGALETNAYIVFDIDSREAMIIDPGAEPDRIYEHVVKGNLRLKYIIATHGHFDHVLGINALRTWTGAKSCINSKDLNIMKYLLSRGLFVVNKEEIEMPIFDFFVDESTRFNIGNSSFSVIETPGHSPGGICIHGNGLLFSGDTLFFRSVGRTDIAEGNEILLQKSLIKLMKLDSEIIVYPGHGPSTTIGDERKNNRMLFSLIKRHKS